MNPVYTIVNDSIPAEFAKKGFSVSDAFAKSDFSVDDAARMGFTCDAAAIKRVMDSDPDYRAAIEKFANDQGLNLGDANIDALGQFFMYFNEATINVLYRGRTAVQNFGEVNMGDWTTERIVFKTRELTCPGASIYDDWSRAPYAAYNYGWDYRDTLRLEWALEVTKLEEAVAGIMRRNAYKDKKDGIVLNQSITFNEAYLYGFSGTGGVPNASAKRLYGLFNDPSNVTKGNLPKDLGSDSITVDEVCACLRAMKQDLVNSLQGNGDIETLPVEIKMPIAWQTALTVQNSYNGYTANKWLAENWKTAKVSYMPELDTADDGDPMIIVVANMVPDVGMQTVNLISTSKLHLIGAMPSLKGREEAYSASIAGAFIAAPMAIKFWGNNA